MIKHDYKPQNNKPLFSKPQNLRIPQWLRHPFVIIAMAVLIALLAFFLSHSPQPTDRQQFNITSVELDLEQNKANTSAPPTPSGVQSETIATDSEDSESALVDNDRPKLQATDASYSDPISIELNIANPQAKRSYHDDIDDSWRQEAVKKGDNLSLIFKRIQLTPQWVYRVVNLDSNTKLLKKLKPGEVLNYKLTDSGDLQALRYSVDMQRTLYVLNENGELRSRMESKVLDKRIAFASGVIDGSLFGAGKAAGLSDGQVMELAGIFDWDIDFILDIRKGDSFSMIYEEEFLDGKKIGDGNILAAEFINQGKSFQAIRYTDSKGRSSYFTPKGLSMRKAFLRAPLKFSYISSSFKPRRFHPILKRWKAHNGIDYRAAKGTPIRAAGDGKVIASTYNKYNGKYVFIQHGQGIITKYLHMSRRAISNGKRVKQGQIIGYVGSTGLAEAPHLHYEFVVNGVHRNPRTVKLPDAKPIAASEKQRFTATAKPLLEKLHYRQHLKKELQIAP